MGTQQDKQKRGQRVIGGVRGPVEPGDGSGAKAGSPALCRPGPMSPPGFAEHTPCPEAALGEEIFIWSSGQALDAMTVEVTQA